MSHKVFMLSFANLRQLTRRQKLWYAIVIVGLVFSLTVSVATRTHVPTISHDVSVQGQLTKAIRQHMDSDAAQWVPPVPIIITAEIVSFYPRVSPTGPPVPGLFFEEALYNRPPPAC